MPDVTLFAGPSAFGVDAASLQHVNLRPPVRRGDVERLLAQADTPGVVVVCDGVFQSEPAVGHRELCAALDAGWQLWGVSSLGAIRAFELRAEGMRGFGYVYSQFERFDDFADDEMCLLHFPEAPYFPVSEPLVNLRFALDRRGEALGISPSQQQRLLAALRSLWFGDRTRERLRHLMLEYANIDVAAVNALLAWLDQHRVKTMDLQDLMTQRPWLPQGTAIASTSATDITAPARNSSSK